MRTTAETTPTADAPETGTGVWLHGVTADVDPATLSGITGMDAAPVRPVRAAGLTAVVSAAPLAEYGEAALRRNLEDLAWLERAARTHHTVVDALSRAGAVVPARLATVHRDDDRVARVLTERREEFSATLARLTGREEWGVKGYVVPGAPPRTAEAAGAGGGAGAAYLRRRRAQLTAREEGQRIAADAAVAVHTALAGYAVAARRHAPQDRRLSGAATAMVLNGAYLIDRNGLAGFSALVGALADRHPELRLELTGPWPPYSFVAEPSAEPAHPVREPA
ncbi:GvpL/GvpF family gas vesicle protein [Micromonospora sp. 4G57]|uniref:GvpL/GvpF family gas vesicle protein n=1 Tax=Micromonospora sicca TaxID=2202420 RepID=A0ABU5JMB2_9ACTN|nr:MULTISPECIES: GvpL/GvpF family gas vesicle protein [unclassified Micromonospora]MDZ5441329.1 GvpL/GvpF family gas vesicle protein [Micromonospora sp. 4G57]MDZ5493762.1 GvpL/GvpF family gas vesicle protein [Micromonospora sp. 4G53]